MRGLRLFDQTDFSQKISVGLYKKKRYTRPQKFCFPLKVSVKKKKSSLFVMRPPIFSEALGFSLLSLYVNPALCLRSIFSLSTCDMSNLCGLQTHSSCLQFLFPSPNKLNFKEDISGFKLFPGFLFRW